MQAQLASLGGPAVSIVVPAYNAQDLVAACLQSIVPQMTAAHELVLVDDGSRDRTAERAQAVFDERPGLRARLVRQPNGGVAAARNRGLLEARGAYLCFVDADDLLLPGALAALDRAIERHRPDVVAWDFLMWHPHKERKTRRVALGYAPEQSVTGRDAILSPFFANRHMYVWAHVIRRAIYAGLPQPVFPPGRVYEDVAVLSRLLSECASLVHLPLPAVAYRQHAASLTRAVSPGWCVDFALALRQVKSTFAECGASQALRLFIDAAACHFYIGIVKNSYQLPWAQGRAARRQVKEIFLDSLFHAPGQVLDAMASGALPWPDPARERAVARQVRLALGDSLGFALARAASRRIKLWQRMAAA